jgi:hypothetical protein
MNFEKYSKQQFESLGLNSPAARQLAEKLQDDVTEEIHAEVLAAFLNVVKGLNAQGHNLIPDGEIRAGDISFRDESVEGQCYLRLGCDVVISAGYAHTLTVDEIEAEIAKGSA